MTAALRLLAVRARSRHELELLLERRGFPRPACARVLSRLGELGYLDDAKFAKDRAGTLLRSGRFGARAVLQRLRAHGLSDAAATRALSAAEQELGFDARATARSVLGSRGLWGRALTVKERAKGARLLLGRGFSPSLVEELLGGEVDAEP